MEEERISLKYFDLKKFFDALRTFLDELFAWFKGEDQ